MLEEEYQLSIPNCRVMVDGVTIPQALAFKKQLEQIDGVESVTWLDDSVALTEPLEMQREEVVRQWYYQESALYSLSIDKGNEREAIHKIKALVEDKGVITGSAANNVTSQETAGKEVASIMLIVVPFCACLLYTSRCV